MRRSQRIVDITYDEGPRETLGGDESPRRSMVFGLVYIVCMCLVCIVCIVYIVYIVCIVCIV